MGTIEEDLNDIQLAQEEKRLMSLSDEEFGNELLNAVRCVADYPKDDSIDDFFNNTYPAYWREANQHGTTQRALGWPCECNLTDPKFITPGGKYLKCYLSAWEQGWYAENLKRLFVECKDETDSQEFKSCVAAIQQVYYDVRSGEDYSEVKNRIEKLVEDSDFSCYVKQYLRSLAVREFLRLSGD